jgi:hypothetical protein
MGDCNTSTKELSGNWELVIMSRLSLIYYLFTITFSRFTGKWLATFFYTFNFSLATVNAP